MTPTLLARMRPFLSVYQEGDTPDPAATLAIGRSEPAGNSEPAGTSGPDNGSGTVADQDVWHFGATGRVMVVMIEAQAVGAKGGRSARQAIVRLRQEASLDQAPYQILTWDTGAE